MLNEFLRRRAAHIAEAAPGSEAARALSDMTDEAVRALARAASSHAGGRYAIIALGGWGRGELLPESDLDLLVLAGWRPERFRPFVEAILYPLWDAGLQLGHQVRTSREQLCAMRDDTATCTAGLTARAIGGDVAWGEQQIAAWRAETARRGSRFVQSLTDRPRAGSPFRLEARLKEGPGGRRDIDELVWLSAAYSGGARGGLDALISRGLLLPEELAALLGYEEALCKARWVLQRDGFGDRLTPDAADHLPAEAITRLHEALGGIAATLCLVRMRIHGQPTEPLTSALGAEQLLKLLGGDLADLRLLESAAALGRLDDLVPRFSELMVCRRPGMGHEYTVGAHCLKAAWLVARVDSDDSLKVSARAAGPRLVQVAALVHDAGKLVPGPGHEGRGRAPSEAAARAFGLTEDQAEAAGRLTALHLLLAETALRQDLDDAMTIEACASRIGDRALVPSLHVLTAVDSMATSDHTWTAWTAALVGQLVTRVDRMLDDGARTDREASIDRAAVSLLLRGRVPERYVDEFLGSASSRYLAPRDARSVAADIALCHALVDDPAALAKLAVTEGSVPGSFAITVAARDAHGVLSRLAGAAALAGLDILEVDAGAGPAGLTLDRFLVVSATDRALTTGSFSAFERFVVSALSDRLQLAVRLRERRRHYPPKNIGPATVESVSDERGTRVQVSAPDRPGLLYEIARAVSETGLDITWAKARTIDGIAHDVFGVSAPAAAVADGELGHLAMRIRESLALD